MIFKEIDNMKDVEVICHYLLFTTSVSRRCLPLVTNEAHLKIVLASYAPDHLLGYRAMRARRQAEEIHVFSKVMSINSARNSPPKEQISLQTLDP
jgi:hypothetical protein